MTLITGIVISAMILMLFTVGALTAIGLILCYMSIKEHIT